MNAQHVSEKVAQGLSKTQQLVEQFDDATASAALVKSTAWLAALSTTCGASVEQRYISIDLVDTATRQHQQRVIDDYLALSPTRRAHEKQFWEAAHGFCSALHTAYRDCLRAAQQDEVLSPKLAAKLPVMAVRAMRTIGMQIKWITFRHGLVEPWVWSNLAYCFQFAQTRGLIDTPVFVYLSDADRLSPQQAFLRVVMCAASDMEGLSALEQEVAGRVIEHLTDYFTLDRRAIGELNWYFDLDHGLPPRRVIGTPVSTAQRRFFGASGALPQLAHYLTPVREVGVSAMPFALPKACEVKHVVRVLDHLAMHWGKPVPARAFERRATTTCMEIRHDYRAVRDVLERAACEQPRLADTTRAEYWIVENAGRGGYGAIVPKGQRTWLHLGVLIAIRLEYQDFWSVAVVRRVETDERRQLKVGIRLIARKPVPALLRAVKRGKAVREEPGILLNTRPSNKGGVHVLMRPDTFGLQEDIEVRYGADYALWMQLKPSRVMEATLDYAWVRYEVQA